MNILHVSASIDPQQGGVSQAILTITAGLSKLGMNNTILCLDRKDASFLDQLPTTIALDSTQNAWCYSANLIPWLKNNLKYYEIVIVHGLWLYHSYAVNKAMKSTLKAGGARFYIMPHGMLDPYFQKASGRKLKAIRNWFYWKFIERRVIANATGLLFTCEEEKNLARKTFRPYLPKGESVVGLGVIEPPAFTQEMTTAFLEKCPQIKDEPFLLFLSRIHPKKGIDLLVKAYINLFERADEEISGQKLPRLVIAGPGLETSFGQELQQLIDAHPVVKDYIHFTGMLSGDSKWGAFYGCDAFVLPSHQENFGIAVAEALACGKPVLISDQVNIWREIEQLGGGIICSDSQEGVLQLLTTWTCLQKPVKFGMSQRARKVYETNFSVNFAAERLAETIKGL